jgi:hypothetical protein
MEITPPSLAYTPFRREIQMEASRLLAGKRGDEDLDGY